MTRLYDNDTLSDAAMREKLRRERRSTRFNRFLALLAMAMVMTAGMMVFFIWLVTQA